VTFSHEKSVFDRSTRIDPPVLYPPYSPLKDRVLRAAYRLPDPRDVVAKLRTRVRKR
jgi:hypothetical protein